MLLPLYSAPQSDALCKEVAKKSHGTIFLGFSGGKDSVCAWLQLKRYFTRIIPFHCASIPNLTFRTKILDYYEYEFQTKILRLMGEDLSMSLKRLVYQVPKDAVPCMETFGDIEDYNKLDILEYLRKKFNLPRAWCAFGVNASDSIDRRIYCNKTGGKSDDSRTFYPCWDWEKSDIIKALEDSELKLAPEYKYAKRSIGGVPCATYNKILKEHFPADFEQLKKWYPLCELKNRREERLQARWEAKLNAQAAANGGKEPEPQSTLEPPKTHEKPESPVKEHEGGIEYESPDSGIYIAPDIGEDEG